MLDRLQLEVILAHLPDPVFVITRSGLYTAVFGGRDDRYYHDGSALVGLNVREFMDEDQSKWLLKEIDTALKTGRLHIVEYALSGQDISKLGGTGPADTMWFEARVQSLPFKVEGEDAVLWVASNITDRHMLEGRLRHLSETDPLTGLLNRRHVEELVHDAQFKLGNGNSGFAVLMIDVDHFKSINDAFGHAKGDRVLCDIASAMKHHLRRHDLASRWGGEEFLVLLPRLQFSRAAVVGERLRRAIEAHDFGLETKVTLSIGVAVSHTDDGELARTVARADEALYRAKQEGRNRVILAKAARSHVKSSPEIRFPVQMPLAKSA